MTREDEISKAASALLDRAAEQNVYLACAESCTGGLIMGALTQIAGSSKAVDRGFVTYTNKAKMQVLGVRAATLRDHGAVSEATANEMVLGCLQNSASQIAVAVTGIAGPDGGTAEKPVGTVCFGLAYQTEGIISIETQTMLFEDRSSPQTRTLIREDTVLHALELMNSALDKRIP